MDIVTCITPNAKQKAIKHNRLDRLQQQLYRIMAAKSLVLLRSFTDKRFLNGRLGSDYRILFSKHIYQGHIVLCVIDFMSRSNRDYIDFWVKIRVLKDTEKLNAHYQKIKKQNKPLFKRSVEDYCYNPTLPLPPEPNEQENLWLACGGKIAQQIMVIETQKWMKAHATKHFMRSSNSIHHQLEAIYDIIDHACSHHETDNPFIETSYLDGEDFRIHLQYFPSHQLLFLLDLTEKDIEQPTKSFTPNVSWETLIKHARRAYPLDVFLLDSDDFAKIQGDDEGNLALSSEEIRILNNVHNATGNRFPLFINGRAGSGKSTILQYLLKDYLYLAIEHWNEKQPYTPLYLTYSKKLLDSATTHLGSLLKNNSKILMTQDKHWEQTYLANKEKVFSATFKLFQSFMIELLPIESRIRFKPKQQIAYAKFKQLWNSSIGRQGNFRHYSVDLVWHVIRTYIKGMSDGLHRYLTPQEYAALPDKYKSVSNEIFAEIYDLLWENWYQKHCEKHQLWDEQDLALTVLAEANFPQCYPAIFCDEAQDFTVIELKILYYLSLFSERNVPHYSIGNIPFVFAGDPLQTLNPTGFRWEAVKSNFYNYLLKPIERRTKNKIKTDINYEELLSNYRSSQNIVDFCNSIQLLRLGLFNNTYHIQPQQTWFLEQGMAPFIYSTKAQKAEELLKSDALVIIPNCHENEEIQYIKSDPLLKKIIVCDEEGISSSVLSPSAAKGLEYNEIVVLYRFGATCPQSLLDRLQGKTSKDPGPAVTIEWEYFLNRFYVAASRAKTRLVILDDSDTLKGFWGIMQNIDADSLNTLLGASINTHDWGGKRLLAAKEGTAKDMEDLLQGRSSDDSKELAEKYYREGIDTESPNLLRRARILYQRLGDNTKALECYANALQMEEKYTVAANTYLSIDEHLLALDCFWQASNFNAINNTCWLDNTSNDLRVVLSQHLHYHKSKLTWTGDLPTTQNILKRLKNTDLPLHNGNQGWRESLMTLLKWFEKDYDKGNHLKIYWTTLRDIAKYLDYPHQELATIAYKLASYTEAQVLWEKVAKTNHDRYYRCLYENSHWPETLHPLKLLQQFEDIISQWQDREQKQFDNLNETQVAIIIEAMVKTGKLVQATRLLKKKQLISNEQTRQQLSKLIWQPIKTLIKQSRTDAIDAIALHMTALIKTQSWTALFSLLSKIDDLKPSFTQTQYYKIDQQLINQLADKSNLEDATEATREALINIIKQRFWAKEEGWLPILEREIGVAVTGAAIEYTRYFEDAIKFYYWVTKYARLNREEHDFFDGRIAACWQNLINQRRLQAKPTDLEERKLKLVKKKLDGSYIELEADPSNYPKSEILEQWQISRIRESLKPTSTAENKAKQTIRRFSAKQDEQKWLHAIQDYTQILAEQEKWHSLAENWCEQGVLKKHYPDTSRTQRNKVLEGIIQVILEPLALSHSIIENKRKDKVKLSKLLITPLKDAHEDTWSGCDRLKVDYDLVGACLERVSRHVDTVNFYQWSLEESRTRRERSYMAERLIAAQEYYAEYLMEDNNSGKQKRIEILQQKAMSLREKYRLVDKTIPRYVEL